MEAAEKINAKLTLAQFDIESERKATPLFKEVAGQWLEIHIKNSKCKTTYDRYNSMLRLYVNPQIGSLEIIRLGRSDVIKTLRSIQAKGKSKSTIEIGRNGISGVCEFAIDEEHIKDNPCVGVIKRLGFQRKKDRKPITVFTLDEVEAILKKAWNIVPNGIPYS